MRVDQFAIELYLDSIPGVSMKICIVDDHQLILDGMDKALAQQYPNAEIFKVQTVAEAKLLLLNVTPDVMVVDLSLPATEGEPAHADRGLELLEFLMQQPNPINLVVQSSNVKSLIRIKSLINRHEGGFTVVDKNQPTQDLLTKIDWSLQGLFNTPLEIRHGLEVKPEWLILLRLAFVEGLQDKAIAQRMNLAESTIRKYWTRIQDALGVYPEEGKNIRIQTEQQARAQGLLD
jgi:DNA-binding NarL/FixJ family response regulator